MSEVERRWSNESGSDFRFLPGVGMQRKFSPDWPYEATCFTLDDMTEFGYVETFDHIPQQQRPQPEVTADELTTLRRFHATVMQATQTESNSRLPQAIFAADAEVRRVVKQEVTHAE